MVSLRYFDGLQVGSRIQVIETTHKFPLLSGYSQSSSVFDLEPNKQLKKTQKDYFIKSFGINVVKKALCQFPECQFSTLKALFPQLKSLSEFIQSDNYLGKIKVEVEGVEEAVNDLTQDNKLAIVIYLLNKLSSELQVENVEYKGTNEFKPYMVKDTFTDKTLNIVNDGNGDQEYGIPQSETTNQALNMDVSAEDWFVFNENYGTSEEKYLVKYIAKVAGQLKQKYSEVYLLRNERHFKLFNFDDGRVFEPDFVLFLVKDDKKHSLYYQVFIEPKGGHLIKHDEWKHNFLMHLKTEHKIEQLWKDRECIVWGMPFYNETETKPDFEKEFSALL